MSFYDFEAIKTSTDILKVAEDLQLTLKKSGAGYRCECPTCGGTRGLVITPGKGYYCFTQMKGGDVIGLVQHALDVSAKDAAGWLTEMYSLNCTSTRTVQSQETGQVPTVPQKKTEGGKQPAPFDPAAFAAKLAFTEEVRDLGYTEQEATAFGIGFYRGHVYKAARYASGVTAGFWKHVDGKWTAPKQWLPDSSNVVPLKRPA